MFMAISYTELAKKITILACIWYCAVVGIGDGISTSVEKPDV
jgi:hypothetical protein